MTERGQDITGDVHPDEGQESSNVFARFEGGSQPRINRIIAEMPELTPEQIRREADQMEAIVRETESFMGHKPQ